MDTCKQEMIIGLMLVLYWKMLFHKSIYFYKILKKEKKKRNQIKENSRV